jgi:uncharacterized iron-regulated protein
MKKTLMFYVIILLAIVSTKVFAERQYAIYETATEKKITMKELADKSIKKDIIFFGEFHDDSIIHNLQKEYLQELYKLNSKIAVSLEMFERDVQPVIDNYLAGKITEDEMVKTSRPWPDYMKFYKPLVELAKTNKAPVIAANIPRKYAAVYSSDGWTGIEKLPPAERVFIAKKMQFKEDIYMKNFYNTMKANMGMDTNAPVSANLENTLALYYGAQVLKDETMGESIFEFINKNKGWKAVHFNGDFHSNSYLGTVQKVMDRDKSAKIAVIAPVYVESGAKPDFNSANKGEGDYIIVLENIKREMSAGSVAGMGGALNENFISSHKIKIKLDPKKHSIEGTDNFRFKNPITKSATFGLLKDLKIESITSPDGQLEYKSTTDSMYQEITIKSKNGEISEFNIKYSGIVNHSPNILLLNQKHSNTPGIIADSAGEGIYLPGGSYFPQADKDLADFDIEIALPKELTLITSGTLVSRKEEGATAIYNYKSELPTDDMILVGGRYMSIDTVYDGKTFSVYTFAPTPSAKTFLNASIEYYKYYTGLFGPYPYSAFKIIENFFASGFGMPGYTLLSNKLMALPWVVLAPGSLAHEFVHNYWGNSIYVNYSSGNWCEGLTTFSTNYYYNVLANKPEAALDWRKKALLSMESLPEKDNYPLAKFESQKNTNDAVIGYQKGGFLFYELLKSMGDEQFFKVLKGFAKKYKGRRASWMSMLLSFSMASQMSGSTIPVDQIFDQYLNNTAIPKLKLDNVKLQGDSLTFEVNQDLKYYMSVPVKVITNKGTTWQNCVMTDSVNKFGLKTGAEIRSITVDPDYQCLRRLNKWEIPYSFSLTLGDNPLFILPSKSSKDFAIAQEFAKMVKESDYTMDAKSIDDVQSADWANRSIIVLGDMTNNNFYKEMVNKYPNGINIVGPEIQVRELKLPAEGNMMLLNCANPKNPEKYLSIIYCSGFGSVDQFRRLFHYQSYSMVLLDKAKPGKPLSQMEIFPTLMDRGQLEYKFVK